MDSLITLVLILAPLFIGFFLPSHTHLTQLADRVLSSVVFLILVVIGIELGMVKDLEQQIASIILYLVTLLALTLGIGTLGLMLFDRFHPFKKSQVHPTAVAKVSLRGSFMQLICLVIGFGLARFFPTLKLPEYSITVLLMILLLLVGVSLKGSGTTLRQALLNRQGVELSIAFMGLTLAAGVLFASVFDEVDIMQGLALASGFGWYSLSGTVITESYNAVWGSVALLNDLSREIIALICIPYLMRRSSSAAIGLAGVTSLDFALPTLQQAGGNGIVPTVISFGFITNIMSPVLMVAFSSI